MIRFQEIETRPIDAVAFKNKAVAQGWHEQMVYTLISKLISYNAPFVIDKNGKVYISNHYRFDLMEMELEEEFFDWFPSPNNKDGDFIN